MHLLTFSCSSLPYSWAIKPHEMQLLCKFFIFLILSLCIFWCLITHLFLQHGRCDSLIARRKNRFGSGGFLIKIKTTPKAKTCTFFGASLHTFFFNKIGVTVSQLVEIEKVPKKIAPKNGAYLM